MAEKPSLYENVTRQVDKAAELMGLDPDIREILSMPTNEIVGTPEHESTKQAEGATQAPSKPEVAQGQKSNES